MARKDPQINIRLPADLKEKITASATANSRSINAEIVHRLEVSFGATGVTTEAVEKLAAVVTQLREELEVQRRPSKGTYPRLKKSKETASSSPEPTSGTD